MGFERSGYGVRHGLTAMSVLRIAYNVLRNPLDIAPLSHWVKPLERNHPLVFLPFEVEVKCVEGPILNTGYSSEVV